MYRFQITTNLDCSYDVVFSCSKHMISSSLNLHWKIKTNFKTNFKTCWNTTRLHFVLIFINHHEKKIREINLSWFITSIKDLEKEYKYKELSNRHFGDPEMFNKPLIVLMGPWSGGKSTMINYLLGTEYTKNAFRSSNANKCLSTV